MFFKGLLYSTSFGSAVIFLITIGINFSLAEYPSDEKDIFEDDHINWINLEKANAAKLPTAIGTYMNGRLQNAMKIDNEGIGFVNVLRNNGANYATHFLISTIEYVTSEMRDRYPNHPRLEITALSKKNGGYSSGHDSHQNGLDMDAAYYYKQNTRRYFNSTMEGSAPTPKEKFVENDVVSNNLDLERNFQIMHLFVSTGRVNAIFTDRSIKKALCDYAKNSKIPNVERTLSKIQHWPDHKTHFHVRLECPKSSRECRAPSRANESTSCAVSSTAIPRRGSRKN